MMTIPLLYFLFGFLTYEVSYSKNIKIFKRECRFFFFFFLRFAFKPYFAELIFAMTHRNCIVRINFLRFRAKIEKISSSTICFATTYDHKSLCP